MWLRIKITAAVAICVLLPMMAAIGAISFAAPAFLRDGVSQTLQAETTSVLQSIEDRIVQNSSHLKAWSDLPSMQDALIADNGGEIARTIADLKGRYPDFASLSVTDARGLVVAATAKDEKGTNLSADEGFRSAASGTAYESAIGVRSATTPETIWFTVPLMANYDKQTVIGTLTGVLDLGALTKSVVKRSVLAANDKSALVLTRRSGGHVIFASRTDINLLQALTQFDTRKEKTNSELEVGDKRFFVATAGSKGSVGLVAHAVMPTDEALAVAGKLSNVVATTAGLAFALAMALVWFLSTPLVQLAESMKRLARGDLFWRMPAVGSRHVFGEMARALEVFRQTKIVRDRIVAREQDLYRAKESAETAAREKSEHLASLSRELRTQLTAIIGLSELINRETLAAAANAHHAGYAKDIGRCGVQLLAVINDLFDLSEAEAGQSVLNEADTDLAALVRESADMMSEAARMAKITLACEGCDGRVMAHVDGQKLKQVLFNLLSNAVKFTSEGGHVSVNFRISSDGNPTIVVQDNGIGMPVNLSPVALTPFSASEDTLGRGRHGAGLGLPLVRRLVDLHQGAVNIESETGKGTTVTITLPAGRLVNTVDEMPERLIA